MNNNVDFIVKNGLQVTQNVTIGSYTLAGALAPIGGMIASGGVGIGTSIVPSGNILAIDGNQNIVGNIYFESGGIIYADGTIQTSAELTGPTGPNSTGPTGPTGAASIITGPTGAASDVTGPTGPSSTGPTGSGSFTLGTTELVLGNTYTTIDGEITWESQQYFPGNIALEYTGNIMFNGQSDTNWQMGLGISNFNTSIIDSTKALQIVHGSGASPNDGWAVGTTDGQSIIETLGSTSAFYVTGTGGLVVLNNASIDGKTSISNTFIASSITSNSVLTVTSGGFAVTGDSSLSGNLSINGDIIITGNTYVSETNVLLVESPIIYVGYNNPSNIYDLGLVASYTESSTIKYTGFVLDHSTDQWHLFDNLQTPPTNTVDWSDAHITPGNLLLGNLFVNNTLNVNGSAIVESITANAASTFNSGLQVDGALLVDNNDPSISDTTGGIIVTGGIGISDNVNVGGSQSLFYGTVGIGTSSPTGLQSYSLVVYGQENVTGNISLSNNASGMSRLEFSDGTFIDSANNIPALINSYGTLGTVQFAGTSNTFIGNSTEFVWDTSIPGLGLGTATPGSLLDVQGSANVSESLSVGGELFASTITSNGTVNTQEVIINANAAILSNKVVSSGNVTPYTVDSFSNVAFRTSHYIVQVTDDTNLYYQSAQIMLLQDGLNVFKTEYNEIYSNTSIGDFEASISDGTISLTFLPTNNIDFTVNVIKTGLAL